MSTTQFQDIEHSLVAKLQDDFEKLFGISKRPDDNIGEEAGNDASKPIFALREASP